MTWSTWIIYLSTVTKYFYFNTYHLCLLWAYLCSHDRYLSPFVLWQEQVANNVIPSQFFWWWCSYRTHFITSKYKVQVWSSEVTSFVSKLEKKKKTVDKSVWQTQELHSCRCPELLSLEERCGESRKCREENRMLPLWSVCLLSKCHCRKLKASCMTAALSLLLPSYFFFNTCFSRSSFQLSKNIIFF